MEFRMCNPHALPQSVQDVRTKEHKMKFGMFSPYILTFPQSVQDVSTKEHKMEFGKLSPHTFPQSVQDVIMNKGQISSTRHDHEHK
jgi:hypothetical protein